ncbi:Phospho-N-acetylmuramoyl-pentapeptide-transferase [Candidatus Fokinia solitaria]|uniref:Phospho-N-acetylmuramoyl-pentapeptide-transferase n=1 Tax=Candidatus Fokinia solitaria TaxID=1802984 RepID=A0A2U8BRI9_9RICK|nr:phospho-N-acetylmuramoyl-pentapeptide-transferase [Candidatus Fokinia solitaria]AWD32949.1 Phospho-N-acetylmuramoyl-pentapeptide-transferase [Candidatus Fokinia solitaria]
MPIITFFSAFFACILYLKVAISLLKKLVPKGQPIRKDGPTNHIIQKKNTPTFGGTAFACILLGTHIVMMLKHDDVRHLFLWSPLLCMLSYGILGFYDDFLKVKFHHSNGLSATMKLCAQLIIGLIVTFYISQYHQSQCEIWIPILNVNIQVSLLTYCIWGAIVLVASSNAFNLTDGVDGLATTTSIIVIAAEIAILYLSSHFSNSELPLLKTVSNAVLLSLCFSLLGSLFGFLVYNKHPAKIFMGDVGSMALGGFIGCIALITRCELLLPLFAIVPVLETLSVILQVSHYKITKNRLFLMTPIHHHYEKKGWTENEINIRFGILSVISCIIGLLLFYAGVH